MSDAVVRLDANKLPTISGTVTGSSQAWFVNFYTTWCGHCVHFAPVYKAFGRDVEGKYKVSIRICVKSLVLEIVLTIIENVV